jgi:hypothetical protein
MIFGRLEPWAEVVGIVQEVTETEDSLTIALYIPSTGTIQRYSIPNGSLLFCSVESWNRTATKIGILKISGNPEHYRIRQIEGGQ